MTEADLRHHVVTLAGHLGLLVQYSTDPRRDLGKGYPDLTIAGVGGCLFRELKDRHGQLSPAQTTWRYTLVADGQDWACWRPIDWDTGRIEAELRRIT
jgi:hypothetical protein